MIPKIILLMYLLLLSIFDIRERKVPVFLLAGGVAAAGAQIVIFSIFRRGYFAENAAGLCISMLPGVFLLLMAWATRKIGYGDGLALLIAGLVTGYKSSVALLCFSMLAAALLSTVLLLLRKADGHTELPFLPILTAVFLAEMLI